jgi:hypothetical protein
VASLSVHSLFYVALILMPVLGWLGTATGGFPVQFFDLTLPGLIPENKELSKTLFQLPRDCRLGDSGLDPDSRLCRDLSLADQT